jgi:large subunit ribosomal protein L9
MQVILMEKVVNLGGLGDVVKVKDGFARNYLIPQGKAKRATQANLKEFEGRRAELERKANEQLVGAQERGAKLEGQKIDIPAKSGCSAPSPTRTSPTPSPRTPASR